MEADEGFRHLGRAEVDVLNACVGAKIEMEKGEEAINVCLAIEEMKRRAAEKAAAEAAAEALSLPPKPWPLSTGHFSRTAGSSPPPAICSHTDRDRERYRTREPLGKYGTKD